MDIRYEAVQYCTKDFRYEECVITDECITRFYYLYSCKCDIESKYECLLIFIFTNFVYQIGMKVRKISCGQSELLNRIQDYFCLFNVRYDEIVSQVLKYFKCVVNFLLP